MVVTPAVRVIGAPGRGRVQPFDTVSSIDFARFVRSESRALSRAFAEYHQNVRKAIVARIARMVITTMSSIRVKARKCCLVIYLLKKRFIYNGLRNK
jgi:hypothetical protein